jgi:spermidine synthase
MVVVFIGGMTSLAVELSASRLLAPYFGTSDLVWAAVIGLILLYLTVGYFAGGWLADRRPDEAVLYQLTAWAGLAIGAIPFAARPILDAASNKLNLLVGPTGSAASFSALVFGGAFLSIVLLFAIPVTLLGCVSPFAIRLSVRDVGSSGNIAGRIYALSTLGSIIGTFTPVLVFIPLIGVRCTFFLFALVLAGLSLIGLMRARSKMLALYIALCIVLIVLIVLVPAGLIKPASGLLFEAESTYHYIQVVRRGESTYLLINEGQALHSFYDPNQLISGGIWDYFLIAPYFTPNRAKESVTSLCIVGLAGGTVARQYTAIYGPIPIDGVEIDPQIVAVGRRYFDMNEPNLRVIVQDGRYFLQATDRRYSVIALDAYRQPYIPFHLATREFFEEVRDHLTDDGVAAINVGHTGHDYRMVDALASTMRSVFPSAYIIESREAFNSLVVATKQPTQLSDFEANRAHLADPVLRVVAARADGHVRAFQSTSLIFTDDWAPVEQLTDLIILRYIVEGE